MSSCTSSVCCTLPVGPPPERSMARVLCHLAPLLTSSIGGELIQNWHACKTRLPLDRYRLVPSFGRSTIRKFSTNASAMKKLAARNFEDLLQVSRRRAHQPFPRMTDSVSQCAIPVFEGLLPGRHNDIVLTLIFRLAEWHALAKLRMATETTRGHMGKTTVQVGKELRRFRDDTCADFTTVALPKEEAAHSRQKARTAAKRATASDGVADAGAQSTSAPPDQTGAPAARRRAKKPGKTFDLQNSKTHNLPDYAPQIRDFGTTDSFSSQVVSYI